MPSTGDNITLARPCPVTELARHGNSSCTCARLRGQGTPMVCGSRIPPPSGQCEVTADLSRIKEMWFPAFSPVPCELGYTHDGPAPPLLPSRCPGDDSAAATCWRALVLNHSLRGDSFTPAVEGLVYM